MNRAIMIGLVITVATITMATTGAQSAEPVITRQNVQPQTQAFLKKAAVEQQIQVALGQLAAAQGKNARVKEFGDEMASAHKKLSRELEELAARRNTQLPTDLADEQKQRRKDLSQLSGHAFDREYMQSILRDHQNHLNEFEESLQTLEDAEVLHWAHKTLTMLRAHVEEARWTLQSLQTS